MPKTWKGKEGGIRFSINDKVAFNKLIGTEVWQEILSSGNAITKKQDFKGSEPTTIRTTNPVNKETGDAKKS